MDYLSRLIYRFCREPVKQDNFYHLLFLLFSLNKVAASTNQILITLIFSPLLQSLELRSNEVQFTICAFLITYMYKPHKVMLEDEALQKPA